MNHIQRTFLSLRRRGIRAFIPFLTVGYPDIDTTEALVHQLDMVGADVLELGLPFSDPLADGPVIASASRAALRQGVTLDDALSLVERLRRRTRLPLVFMGYYNVMYSYGEERFVRRAVQAGLDGLIVADLPPEEAHTLVRLARDAHLAMIFLVTPVTSVARIRTIARQCSGFIYGVSYTGTTGRDMEPGDQVRDLAQRVRSATRRPLAVGFGISSPEAARQAAAWSDGVIVGSALLRAIEQAPGSAQAVRRVEAVATELCRAVKSV